jgi:Glycosyl transferase family 90
MSPVLPTESISTNSQEEVVLGVPSSSSSSSSSSTSSSSSHVLDIPVGSCSTTIDTNTTEGSDSDNTKNSNKKKMNVIRHRRGSIMKSFTRWDRNDTTATNNNNTTNTSTNVQQQSSNYGTTTSRTFSHTLVYSIASMSLLSVCTTFLWMFQVPTLQMNNNSFIHQLIPSFASTTMTSDTNTYNHHQYHNTIRPPPILSVGSGAKFYIEDPNRRLESDTLDFINNQRNDNNNQQQHPPKVITFRNIAQSGSTDYRIYTNRNKNHDVTVTSHGETRTTTTILRNEVSQVTVQQPEQQFVEVDLNMETGRKTRFPSVDERVRVYMSNWYLPPCPTTPVDGTMITNIGNEAFAEYNFKTNDKDGTQYMIFREVRTAKEKKNAKVRSFVVDDSTGFDVLRHLNKQNMMACKSSSYCTDFVKYLFPAMDRATTSSINKNLMNDVSDNVLMYQFSDAERTRAYNVGNNKMGGNPNVPNLKKFRYAISKEERERVLTPMNSNNNNAIEQCAMLPRPVPMTIIQQQMIAEGETDVIPTSQPIIMKLKIQRHYGYVQNIPQQDIDWSKKKNQAIFRGQFTGRFPLGFSTTDIQQLSPVEQCNLLHRCRLVYNSALHMKLIDAKLALPVLDVRKDFPQVINDVPLYGERVTIEEMLQYKAIIMLEGNDVSSGLKWALYSNSVVMTQTPTKTSWAMEELLEPWVHYVPLNDDLSDVEEKMQWIIDHDSEAQQIAYRGKLWIHDLVFHPDASFDEALIFDEILRRTKAHFVHNPNMEPPIINIDVM